MRIAYVCLDPGVPVFGAKGCSIHVQEMLRVMLQAGHDVTLFANRFDGATPIDLERLRLQPLSAIPKGTAAQREQATYAQNEELAHQLDRAGAFDLIYERHSLWSLAALEFASRRGIPSVLEVNAPLIREQASHRTLVHHELATQTSIHAFRHARHILCVSSSVANYVRALSHEHPGVFVEPNGVNLARFNSAPASNRSSGEFTVGFVGTLKPWHGVNILIEAFAHLSRQNQHARLLIVGDGPERDNLARQATELGLDQAIRFTGAVAHGEIPALVARMDAATAPYPAMQGFYFSPLKLLEYMAAGRAIVASRIGQIENLICDGHEGLLVNPGNPLDLFRALQRLAQNSALRKQLGTAARAVAASHHGWDAVLSRILSRVREGQLNPQPDLVTA